MGNDEIAVRTRGLTKVYGKDGSAVLALDGVNLELRAGEMTAVVGASGSGKSTLLHVMSGLDSPTSGDSWVCGTHVQELHGKGRAKFRRERMGFVFQQHSLIPVLTVRENILLESSLNRRKPDSKAFRSIVKELDLVDRLDHMPDELSGGQRQKTAIARVMMQQPDVVFADEPTGSLDVESGRTVMGLLHDLVDSFGITVVIVTHSIEAAMGADRVIALRDGRVILDSTSPTILDLENAVSTNDVTAGSGGMDESGAVMVSTDDSTMNGGPDAVESTGDGGDSRL